MPARSKVAQAVMELREAEVKRARAEQFARDGDSVGRFFATKDAEQLEASAEAVLMQATGEVPVVRGMGEVTPIYLPEGTAWKDRAMKRQLTDSLTTPGMVEAQAALERSTLLVQLGSLEMSLDLQKSIDPQNSIERMLCGQMASSHITALKVLMQAQEWLARAGQSDDHNAHWQQQSVEATRLLNVSARLMSSFQDGALTLQKLRQGGKQEMHVYQHVQVAGGQTVIAGNVHQGGSLYGNGGVVEKEGTMPCTQPASPSGTPTCNERIPPHAALPKPARKRRAKRQPCAANGVAGNMAASSPELPEATSVP